MHPTTDDQRPTASKVFRILFVCTGNTCRSPMAEGLCRSLLRHFRMQQEVEVASAGLNASAGAPASREAVAIMRERMIDLSGCQAVSLTAEKAQWADLILVMEERHRQRLLERFPEAAARTFVLKEYLAAPADRALKNRSGGYDILDPFGQSAEAYRRCAMELADAVTDLCIEVHRRLKQGESQD